MRQLSKFVMLRLCGANPYQSMANGGGGDAPPPPDYVGAANAQGVANVEAARATARLNNPSFSNPYGGRTVQYGYNGDPDQVYINDTLTPLGQQRFDQEQRINSGLGGIAEGGINRVGNMLGTQFDMSQVAGRPDLNNTFSRDQMTKSIIDRNQPMMDQRRAAMNTQLSNQGIFQGSDAYKNAQDDLARQENDFNLAAIQQGGAEQSRQVGLQSGMRNQDIQTQAYLRSLPLNEINALRTGSQTGMPNFQSYGGGGNVQAADILGATGQQYQGQLGAYNADQAQAAGNRNAAIGAGTALAGAAAMMF